ncbi:MAG: hypothetical protein ABEH83_04480 [Halobacterium sp.]
MVSARLATAAVGVVASLAVSVLLWKVYGVPLFFLAVPFVPFLFRGLESDSRPPVSECPECGFRTRDPEFAYCPRDGTRLEEG